MKQATDQDLHIGKWLTGAALGAVVMYLLDPERGARRRAESGRTLRELGRQTGDVFDRLVQGLGKQAGGMAADMAQHAGSAGGAASNGSARNTGSAGAADSRTPPAWPGGDGSARARPLNDAGAHAAPEVARQAGWGGGRRGVAVAGGGALSLAALLSGRSALGLGLGLAGLSLLARGASNRPLRSLIGAGSQPQAVEVDKSIRIDAAPEQVYDQFASYENFPRFMSNVVDVRDLGNGRSHWVVKGPAGTEFAWNAVLTEQDRPRRLAWQSEPDAEIAQAGTITFEPIRSGTRVTVHLSYRPPAGAVGHAVASLLGSDPKRQMDEDLARMKSLVERGAMLQAGHAGQAPASSQGKFLH